MLGAAIKLESVQVVQFYIKLRGQKAGNRLYEFISLCDLCRIINSLNQNNEVTPAILFDYIMDNWSIFDGYVYIKSFELEGTHQIYDLLEEDLDAVRSKINYCIIYLLEEAVVLLLIHFCQLSETEAKNVARQIFNGRE